MRAIVCTEYGTPDTLELQEIQDPVPGPEQVLVRIHAAGVNFIKGFMRCLNTYRCKRESKIIIGT